VEEVYRVFLMGKGRVAGTERMPNLFGGNTEQPDCKLKNRNKFRKPNFEPLPS
jgi:hypothetical protein